MVRHVELGHCFRQPIPVLQLLGHWETILAVILVVLMAHKLNVFELVIREHGAIHLAATELRIDQNAIGECDTLQSTAIKADVEENTVNEGDAVDFTFPEGRACAHATGTKIHAETMAGTAVEFDVCLDWHS